MGLTEKIVLTILGVIAIGVVLANSAGTNQAITGAGTLSSGVTRALIGVKPIGSSTGNSLTPVSFPGLGG
jgi:hypothetical protein